MDLENIFMGKILVVDLNKGSCEEEDLTEEMVAENIGGAAINLALYKEHRERDPLVFGTGPLTGTFAPSGCAGVVTGRSPVTGKVCHVPLLWQTAVELKYSGFDFLVILGASENPVRLWLHDELAELLDAGEMWGKDVWESTDFLRVDHGDDYVQAITIGPAGETGSALAQLSENYWGSRDVFGLGAVLGNKKLKAVAMRGMGTLEVAEDFFDLCTGAQKEIRKGAIYGKGGMIPLLESLGMDSQDLELLKQKAHRNTATFNCAYPAYTFLMLEETQDLLHESKKDEPGLLLTDPAGVVSLLGLKEGLPMVLRRINRMGMDPIACGLLLAKENITQADEAEKKIRELAGSSVDLNAAGVENVYGAPAWPLTRTLEERLVQALAVFSPSVPPRPLGGEFGDFSISEDPLERAQWWLERMAAGSILGICPLSTLLSPVFSLEEISAWGAKAAGWEELTEEKLRDKSRALVAETASLEEPNGAVPSDWVSGEWEDLLKKLTAG